MTTQTSTEKDIVIRAGAGTLDFLIRHKDGTASYHPYNVNEGMSLPANLREAFRQQDYLQIPLRKAYLMVATPMMLVPQAEYQDDAEFNAESAYSSVITGRKGEKKITRQIADLDVVSIFTVNRDLEMVVGDNSPEVEVSNVSIPVWQHEYNRYYQSGQRRKLFAYFHDRMVDVCCYEQHRIRFANTFDVTHAHDALYYILYVWKQLGMNQQEDDLFVVGKRVHEEWLRNRLGSYINRVHEINPSADLNRSPLADIVDMPFDLMLCGAA